MKRTEKNTNARNEFYRPVVMHENYEMYGAVKLYNITWNSMDSITLHGSHGMYIKIFFFFEKTVKIKVLQPPPCTISLPFFVFCIYHCELECDA